MARLRLLQRFDAALRRERCLILVSAPAGFGKTTLLVEWIQASQLPAAWLSLDKGDNQPARFLAYLSAALEKVRPAIRADRLAPLPAPPVSAAEPILTTLINRLDESTSPFVLILDNYHAIDAPAIHAAVAFLSIICRRTLI